MAHGHVLAPHCPRGERFARQETEEPVFIGKVQQAGIVGPIAVAAVPGGRRRSHSTEHKLGGMYALAAPDVRVRAAGGAGLGTVRTGGRWRGWYVERPQFLRRTAGVLAPGSSCGGCSVSTKHTGTAWNVSFEEVSLGGDIGRRLVAGFLGSCMAQLFIVAAALWRRPDAMVCDACAVVGRGGMGAAAAASLSGGNGTLAAVSLRRPSDADEEIVIGGGSFERLEPMGRTALEGTPVIFRPSIDPASPSSPVGTGARRPSRRCLQRSSRSRSQK